jgi:hypothetical protein
MGDISIGLFKRLNAMGRLVILLDGFDEMLSTVTKPDRRRCFREIAEFVGEKTKIIVTGRPAYFPDHMEFSEVLSSMKRVNAGGKEDRIIIPRITCLQLMDEAKVEAFMRNYTENKESRIVALLTRQQGLLDLARRPVLAGMIAETASRLEQIEKKEVTPRLLYDIYTDRWMQIEEDKGSFRTLIDPKLKSAFVRYLAVQMFLANSDSIHYSEMDKRIASFFNISNADRIDHFSHDVRTCSFLNRTDQGEYHFIHRSFMEYFVAREYERLEESPFRDVFDKPITEEIISFLDFDSLSEELRIACIMGNERMRRMAEYISQCKESYIHMQEFERASEWRDLEREFRKLNGPYTGAFVSKGGLTFAKKSSELFGKLKRQATDEEMGEIRRIIGDDIRYIKGLCE